MAGGWLFLLYLQQPQHMCVYLFVSICVLKLRIRCPSVACPFVVCVRAQSSSGEYIPSSLDFNECIVSLCLCLCLVVLWSSASAGPSLLTNASEHDHKAEQKRRAGSLFASPPPPPASASFPLSPTETRKLTSRRKQNCLREKWPTRCSRAPEKGGEGRLSSSSMVMIVVTRSSI